MRFSILYVTSIVAINMSFSYVKPIILFDGTIWSVGSLLAGATFILRDYSQREIGHKVLLLMALSATLSYLMADPFVAVASLCAFAISEVVDWLVFTFREGSFKSKVITSGLISVPIDTIVFLSVINQLSVFSFAVMTASKLIAILFVLRGSNG